MSKFRMPRGFKCHRGGKCPVDGEQYVEMLILTGEGLGSSGIIKALYHEWRHAEHEEGLGAVVGYRLAERGEPQRFDRFKRIKLPENHGLIAA